MFNFKLIGTAMIPNGIFLRRTSKVLIIEDDDFYFESLQRHFKRLSAHIFHAMSLSAAMEAVEDNDFDLIIIDLGLPDFGAAKESEESRLKVLRTIVSASPLSIALVITGRYCLHEVKKCQTIGAKGYFSKSQLTSLTLTRLLDQMTESDFVVHTGMIISNTVREIIPALSIEEEECLQWVEKRPAEMKRKDVFARMAEHFNLSSPVIAEQKYKRARSKVISYKQHRTSTEDSNGDK